MSTTNQNERREMPQPGDVLPNGATVVLALAHQTDPTICYVGASVRGHHPYATWTCSVAHLSTYWGHYFKTPEAMLHDLRARA